MANVKEMLLIYIVKLYEKIADECFERSAGSSPIVGPKCPYHLFHDIEKNRAEILREIQQAEFFLGTVLKANLPRKSPEVSEWFTKE